MGTPEQDRLLAAIYDDLMDLDAHSEEETRGARRAVRVEEMAEEEIALLRSAKVDGPPVPDTLHTAAERLARTTGAVGVVLFGSRARGDADEGSDWDLCVLLPDDVAPGLHTSVSLWPLVAGIGLPIQVVPIRVSVFLGQRHDVNSLSHDIARDGVVIHGMWP